MSLARAYPKTSHTEHIFSLSRARGTPGTTSSIRHSSNPYAPGLMVMRASRRRIFETGVTASLDRKSTRLNSSHSQISYAVFCLKKKKEEKTYRCLLSETQSTN